VLAAHGLAGLTGIVTIGLVAEVGWNGISNGLLYGDAGRSGGSWSPRWSRRPTRSR
jgi:hypothetical protein